MVTFLNRWRWLAQVLVVAMVVQGVQVNSWPLFVRRHVSDPSPGTFPLRTGPSPTAPSSTSALAMPAAISFGTEAHAQTPPPSYVPLPSPITLARTQSAFSLDTLAPGNQLTITYTIFNTGDEEVGEPLLVT